MGLQDQSEELGDQRSAVTRGRNGQSKVLRAAALLCVGLVLTWVWYTGEVKKSAPTDPVEEFRANTYTAPDVDASRSPKDNSVIVMTPPPAPAPPEPVAPAPPVAWQPVPVAPEGDEDAEARTLERLRSPAIILDNSGGAAGASQSPSGQSFGSGSPEAGSGDPNKAFLAQVSDGTAPVSTARRLKRLDALVAQGTFIRGTLETAINSDLAGNVRAVTLEDVWSFDGRRVLIPAGSRLVGEYRSGLSRGQSRVFVVWTRLLRPDGVDVSLGSIGTDALGRSGMPGDVDRHWFERFGSAIVLSVVGGISTYVAGLGENNTSTSTNTDSVQSAQTIAQQTVAQTFADLANTALQDNINIPPTINIDQGTPVIVFVRRDLDFSAVYPDPLAEALRAIRGQ